MSDSSSANPTEPANAGAVRLGRDLAQVGPAVDELLGWLRNQGAPAGAALDEIALVVTEALTNAIRHGGGGADEFTTRLAWTWQANDLTLEVSEPGLFEPKAAWKNLPDDPLSEGGRGGFLITRLMDAVEHRNADGRHALRMRRRLERRPGL